LRKRGRCGNISHITIMESVMTHPLLAQARAVGTPVITGDQAIFVFEGANPPLLVGDFNDWDAEHPASWQTVAPGVWSHTVTLPPDAYIEYGFRTDPDDEDRVPDPFNARTTPNGMGHLNHYFYMPAAIPTPLTQRARSVPQGLVTRHILNDKHLIAGGKRLVHLYRPPTDAACPLLVVYDGNDYLRRARLPAIVDNLIAQRRMRPVALALVENSSQARMIEYACNEATVGFVMAGVLPLARQHLNLLDPDQEPGAFGVLGASMGGLMALYTGLRLPHVFGHVLSQSGAFRLDDNPTVVIPLVEHLPVPPLKIWLDVGRYEWLLAANREMQGLLARRGFDYDYREFNAGHNYPAWREDLWRGLEWLFPA